MLGQIAEEVSNPTKGISGIEWDTFACLAYCLVNTNLFMWSVIETIQFKFTYQCSCIVMDHANNVKCLKKGIWFLCNVRLIHLDLDTWIKSTYCWCYCFCTLIQYWVNIPSLSSSSQFTYIFSVRTFVQKELDTQVVLIYDLVIEQCDASNTSQSQILAQFITQGTYTGNQYAGILDSSIAVC